MGGRNTEPSAARTQSAERVPQGLGEQSWFGDGREVAAAVVLVPSRDGEVALGELARWFGERHSLAAEDAHSGRDRGRIAGRQRCVLSVTISPVRRQRGRDGLRRVIEDLGKTLQMLGSATDFSLVPWRLASGM